MFPYVPEPMNDAEATSYEKMSSVRRLSSTCSTVLLDESVNSSVASAQRQSCHEEDFGEEDECASPDNISLGSTYRDFYKDLPVQVHSSECYSSIPCLDNTSCSEESFTPLTTPVSPKKIISPPSSFVASGKLIEFHAPSTQSTTVASSLRESGAHPPIVPLLFSSAADTVVKDTLPPLVLSDSFQGTLLLELML
jgi:hypothetical protein